MDVIYTPVAIDGVSGYFLSDEEYQKLYRAASGDERDEYVEGLEIENRNLRDAIKDAQSRARELAYDLGNA